MYYFGFQSNECSIFYNRNVTHVSSSFSLHHFRDQHKLNFGTKFLLGGETVTTRIFKTFPQSLFINHYSSFTIHRSLFIILLFIIFGIRLWFREALLFTRHYSSREENTIHGRRSFYRKLGLPVCVYSFVGFQYLNSITILSPDNHSDTRYFHSTYFHHFHDLIISRLTSSRFISSKTGTRNSEYTTLYTSNTYQIHQVYKISLISHPKYTLSAPPIHMILELVPLITRMPS